MKFKEILEKRKELAACWKALQDQADAMLETISLFDEKHFGVKSGDVLRPATFAEAVYRMIKQIRKEEKKYG